MDNRQVAEAFAVETGAAVEAAGIVSEVEETSSPERYPNRFKPKKVSKTGDGAPLALWLGLILVGLIGVGGTLVWKAKKQR